MQQIVYMGKLSIVEGLFCSLMNLKDFIQLYTVYKSLAMRDLYELCETDLKSAFFTQAYSRAQ